MRSTATLRGAGGLVLFLAIGAVASAQRAAQPTISTQTPIQAPSNPTNAAALIEHLADETKGPRAADQLLRVDPQTAVPALVKALGETYPVEVRWRAARTLGRIGPPAKDAVGALIAVLGDPSPNVRSYACFALGRIGGPSAQAAVPGLVERMTDENGIVRRAAMDAILAIGPDRSVVIPLMVKALEDAEPRIVTAALRTLASQGEVVVPVLIEALKSEKSGYWAMLALEQLGPQAKDAVPALTAMLAHQEPEVRMEAIMALGAIGEAARSAAPRIAERLQHDEMMGVRYAAVFALGRIEPGPEVEPALKAALSQQGDPLLAMLAAAALAKMHPQDQQIADRANELIVAGLQSENPTVQSAAARVLAESNLGSEVTATALVTALENASPEVIPQTINALAALGSRATPQLIRGLSNDKLRPYAIQVLKMIGPDAASAAPQLVKLLAEAEDPAERREIQFALAALGPAAAEAVPELIESLSSENEEIKYSAIYALGRMGEHARPAYNELMNNLESENEFLQVASTWAMVRIDPGQPRIAEVGVPLLAKALQSDREVVRVEAASTLGELGESAQAALPALKGALRDQSPAVQEAAQKAIERIEGE